MTPAKTFEQWIKHWNNLARAMADAGGTWSRMSTSEIEAILRQMGRDGQ